VRRAALSRPFSYHGEHMPVPRVLIVMEAQWPRALLLAALQEEGYDAVGASTLDEALSQSAQAPGRASLGLIVVDHHISRDDPLFKALLQRHPDAQSLFLESALQPSDAELADDRLRYPLFIGEVVRAIQRLLPLPRSPTT
jgi:CheY-like chemotaxis protein